MRRLGTEFQKTMDEVQETTNTASFVYLLPGNKKSGLGTQIRLDPKTDWPTDRRW
jgi:hypothetical protein